MIVRPVVIKALVVAPINSVDVELIIRSLATPKPPSVWIDPVVVLVDSVVSSIERTPEPVIVEAVNAAVAHVPPATVNTPDVCVTVISV